MALSNLPIGLTKHVQSEPADTWVIEHTTPGYPVVDVYTESNGIVQKILPAAVVYINQFTVEVRFAVPRTGFATVIV